MKLQLLSDLGRRRDGDDLFSGLEVRLREGLPKGSAALARSLERLLLSTGRWLAEDEAAQVRLNGWARLIASKVIAPRRHEIGHHVAQVVAGWDARDVADKLELQVGRDLQQDQPASKKKPGTKPCIAPSSAASFGAESVRQRAAEGGEGAESPGWRGISHRRSAAPGARESVGESAFGGLSF